jgi:Mg2+/Co2+ transporter CorB
MEKILDFAFQGIDQFGEQDLAKMRSAQNTLFARADESAVDVARRVAREKSQCVIVVDEMDKVRGVLVHSYINEQLSGSLLQKTQDLSEGILKLAQTSRVGKAGGSTTPLKPQLFYCAKGKHFTSENPCSEHP